MSCSRWHAVSCVVLTSIVALACSEKVLEPERADKPQLVIDDRCCPPDAPSGCGCAGGPGSGQTSDGSMQLNCDEIGPTRLESISCDLVALDSVNPVVMGWRYESDSLRNPVIRTVDPTDTSWAGQIAVTGRVKVLVSIDDRPDSAVVPITVIHRSWDHLNAFHKPIEDVTPSDLPEHPEADTALGKGSAIVVLLQGTDPRVEIVPISDQGPNHGLILYNSIPFEVDYQVAWNSRALVFGSDFYNLQNPTGDCGRSRVLGIIPDVKLHEGFPPPDMDSHAAIYRATVDSVGRRIGESFIAQGLISPNRAREMVQSAAIQQSLAFDDDTTRNQFRVSIEGTGCDFNYFPS